MLARAHARGEGNFSQTHTAQQHRAHTRVHTIRSRCWVTGRVAMAAHGGG